MTEPPSTDATDASAALTAFLRGIERRGVMFADLHCGDPVAADQAYAIALRMFREHAQQQPFVQWPRLFWRALLAAPPLRASGAAASRRGPAFVALDQAGAGPRAALLLRLVAGLTDADAASVLGIAVPTYRLALQRALPHGADGSPDADAWRRLAEASQAGIRNLPAERLAHLARLRQAAVQGRRPDLIGPLPPPATRPEIDARPRPRLRGWLWAGVAACAAGLAASFLWPYFGNAESGDPRITIRPLPPARSPAARYDQAMALLTERDFELLAEADPQPPAGDPAFYAWYAVWRTQGEAGRDPDAGMRQPQPLPGTAPESAQPESTLSESSDAP